MHESTNMKSRAWQSHPRNQFFGINISELFFLDTKSRFVSRNRRNGRLAFQTLSVPRTLRTSSQLMSSQMCRCSRHIFQVRKSFRISYAHNSTTKFVKTMIQNPVILSVTSPLPVLSKLGSSAARILRAIFEASNQLGITTHLLTCCPATLRRQVSLRERNIQETES